MFGGLNRLLAAGFVAAAFLVAPSAALACNGGVSAVNVYKECLQTGGGGKSSGKKSGGGPTTGGQAGSTSVPISSSTKKKLKSAGSDGKSLSHLVRRYGDARVLEAHTSGTSTAPTAIGSAFDLGSGPTAVLVALLGAAVVLLAASGLRSFRQRHR